MKNKTNEFPGRGFYDYIQAISLCSLERDPKRGRVSLWNDFQEAIEELLGSFYCYE